MKAYQVIRVDWDIVEEKWEKVENVIGTYKNRTDCLVEVLALNKTSKEHSKYYPKKIEVK